MVPTAEANRSKESNDKSFQPDVSLQSQILDRVNTQIHDFTSQKTVDHEDFESDK